jgi:hypothetical protein
MILNRTSRKVILPFSLTDVVIGAPYENDKGAVYIYLGGMYDIHRHPETGYWQRIAAADFVFPLNNLKGFGISLVAADMDGNSYPGIYFKFCTIIAK